MEPTTKPWWQSKGVWGGLVATFAGVAGMAGLEISPADTAEITELVSGLAVILGGLAAVYGRIVASHKVS